jgi:hypothetical protein
MKKYSIFLASSAELDSDKVLLENCTSKKNKEWHSRNVFLALYTWKDFIDAISDKRTQDLYNEAIRKSDVVVVLFHTKLGRYTNEEFEVAYDAFLKNKGRKPRIFTYFKDDGSQTVDEIEGFKEKLDKLGHFYSLYKNDDDLNYKFDLQLDRLANEVFIKLDTFNWGRTLRYLLFFFLIPLITLFFTYRYLQLSKSFDLTIMVNEARGIPNMPFSGGSITLTYGEKQESRAITTETSFRELPPGLRNQQARLLFEADGYTSIDTLIRLKKQGVLLNIKRNATLARIFGVVKDNVRNAPLQGVNISVSGLETQTGADGRFSIDIPLHLQKKEQRLTATKDGYKTWDHTLPVSDKNEWIIHLEQE